MSDERDAPVGGALLAGSASAIAASLVSLPLHSPHDALLNSASVTWGTLAVSALAGILWRRLRGADHGRRLFTAALAGGFAGWIAAAFAGEAVLERTVSFTAPLAAIAFGGVAAFGPALSGWRLASRRVVVVAAVAVAAATGVALAGFGDAESGRLELPPRGGVASGLA